MEFAAILGRCLIIDVCGTLVGLISLVNLLQRQGNDLLIRHIDTLRNMVRSVKARHPFLIHGWLVLPEHLHCVIELPRGDADFATRWRLIQLEFSKSLPVTGKAETWRAGYMATAVLGTSDLQ